MVEKEINEEINYAALPPEKISTDLWTVSVLRSVEGGGTGQEFYTNLQVPGDGPGNKWYDCSYGTTWIQGDFKECQRVRMISLKSANDCPERDPYKIQIEAIKKDKNAFELVDEFDDIEFSNRYEFIDFMIPCDYYKTIRINIVLNKSMKLNNNWGSGTQLAELVFYK